jgi:hypothetical protein
MGVDWDRQCTRGLSRVKKKLEIARDYLTNNISFEQLDQLTKTRLMRNNYQYVDLDYSDFCAPEETGVTCGLYRRSG